MAAERVFCVSYFGNSVSSFDVKEKRCAVQNFIEVTLFCKRYGLEDLVCMFYGKKILFDDDYFAQLDVCAENVYS